MAGHDFAHNEAPSRPNNSAASTLMPVMAILMVAVLCFAAGFWLGGAQSQKNTHPAMKSTVAEAEYANLKARFEQQQQVMEALSDELQKWKAMANRDPSSKVGDLQFYKELPRQSVMPAPLAEPGLAPSEATVEKKRVKQVAEKPVQPITAGGHADTSRESSQMLANIIGRELKRSPAGEFRIQAGSFRSVADAKPLLKRLEAAGFSGFSENVDLGSKGHWNRVYVGPFETRGAAEKARRKLRDRLHIKGLLVRKKANGE